MTRFGLAGRVGDCGDRLGRTDFFNNCFEALVAIAESTARFGLLEGGGSLLTVERAGLGRSRSHEGDRANGDRGSAHE